MADQPENPPAFPVEAHRLETLDSPHPGMTLRDYFAGQALVEVSSLIQVNNPATYDVVARFAYDLADAMLRERGK